MGFEKIVSLDSDVSISLGGRDKKTGKANLTSVEGYFLGTKTGIPNKFNPDKPDCLHIFQTSKGNVGVWGKSHLNPQMSRAIVGAMVRVTFTGTRPSKKGNDQLLFSVEQDKSNAITVDALQAQDDDSYSVGAEESYDDIEATEEAPYTPPPVVAKAPAKAPDAARQAKVAALLQGTRSKAS